MNNSVNNTFFIIDSKNNYKIKQNIDNVNKNKLDTENESILPNSEKRKIISNFLVKFLDKKMPGCKGDGFTFSLEISKHILSKYNITKTCLSKYIEYFFKSRYELMFTSELKLNLENIRNIGLILCYSYSKFSTYKIYDFNKLKITVEKIMKSKINILTEYYNYCNNNNKDPLKESKIDYFDNIRYKYTILPELIFLINRFENKNIVNIDINFDTEKLNEDEYKLLIITILNLQNLLLEIKKIKLNLISFENENKIYKKSYKEIENILKIYNKTIKKSFINNKKYYEIKWDFNYKYQLEEFRKINENKINEERLEKEKENNENLNNALGFEIVETPFYTEKVNKFNNLLDKINLFKTPIIENNMKEDNDCNINNNFDIIIITACRLRGLTSVTEIELFINELYIEEFRNYIYKLDILNEEVINELFLLDFFNTSKLQLVNLNIEMNALDCNLFSKCNELIINQFNTLKNLNISFFTADITYFQEALFRLYTQTFNNNNNELLKANNENDIETTILNEVLNDFCKNLSEMFNTIYYKLDNLINLGLNFDIPQIITFKYSYLNAILKFIFNILFLVNLPSCKLNTLILLSPQIKVDTRSFPGIENILSNINFENKNKNLKYLSIHFQFFRINNISNLISQRLIFLNIGDLDYISFKYLVIYLNTLNFSKNSCLKQLNISILKIITEFDFKLKLIIRKLFNLKLKSLIELNLYTNIYLHINEDYKYLIDCINKNWISNVNITLNKKSNKICNQLQNLLKNVYFLINPKLEDKLLSEEQKFINKIKNKNKFKEDAFDVYFNIKLKLIKMISNLYNNDSYNNLFTYSDLKNILFTIMQYIYFIKEVNISHNINISKLI